ncbi:hypothetical protein [Tateyamaria sp. Alg231-49]|uniref:hypothetical protein n=1 Tax=Tateyamaria sp. Alg231-49 TaxID=1922219 RepID=UPI000D558F94|nr:hypothetical protein [Tateyamaria sp. Alg231-49]
MIYTLVAAVVAILLVLSGVLRIVMGFVVDAQFGQNPKSIARSLGNYKNTGEVIDRGLTHFALGVTLGGLTYMSKSLALITQASTDTFEEGY